MPEIKLDPVKNPTDIASFTPEGYVPPNSADGCEVRRMNLEYNRKHHDIRMLVLNAIEAKSDTWSKNLPAIVEVMKILNEKLLEK